MSSLLPWSSHLSSLGVAVPAKDRPLLEKLGKLVLTCHNLNSLRIFAAEGVRSTPIGGPSEFSGVTDYRWIIKHLQQGCEFSRLKELELSNFCVCEANDWHLWSDSLHWSLLSKACFTCPSFITKVGSGLSNLQSLILRLDPASVDASKCCPHPHSEERIRDILLSFDGLADLELRNASPVLDPALVSHLGRTLRSLRPQEDEYSFSTPYSRHILSPADLALMAANSPLLRDLAIDTTRANSSVSKIIK